MGELHKDTDHLSSNSCLPLNTCMSVIAESAKIINLLSLNTSMGFHCRSSRIFVHLSLLTCMVVQNPPRSSTTCRHSSVWLSCRTRQDHRPPVVIHLYGCRAEPAKIIVHLSSFTCMVVVAEPAKIIDHLSSGATVVVQEGETVELVCNVTGVPHPTVTWFRIPTGLMHESDRTLEADRRKKRESRAGGLLGDLLALTVTSRSDLIDLVSHFG